MTDNHLLVAWQLSGEKVKNWTKKVSLNYFGISAESLLNELPVRESSMHIIKNTVLTQSFYREFSLICGDQNFKLVDDSLSDEGEQESFREHRHDQAIFSLLTYQRNIGIFLENESYFADEWKRGTHPRMLPFAAMRNKSGVSMFSSDAKVLEQRPGFFSEIEGGIAKGSHWGDAI